MWEDAVVGWRNGQDVKFRPEAGNRPRVIEPEIDMNRSAIRRSLIVDRLLGLVRVLKPASDPIGPPMRSVARAMEEEWPAREA
jgi:hypothetical protein